MAAGEGTTSACAENTGVLTAIAIDVMELPPRARRIPNASNNSATGLGTTSACAENTFRTRPRERIPWNYLRVRGEYRVEDFYPWVS